MHSKKFKKRKPKVNILHEKERADQKGQQKSQIAKKELALLSFEQEDTSCVHNFFESSGKDKKEEDIRTRVSTLDDPHVSKKQQSQRKRKKQTKSRYLSHGYFQGKKYQTTPPRVTEKRSKLSINYIGMEPILKKSIKDLSIEMSNLLRQKKHKSLDKEKILKHPNSTHRLLSHSTHSHCKNSQNSPKRVNSFIVFNDVFIFCGTERNTKFESQKIETTGYQKKSSDLRPEFLRLISKIKCNQKTKEDKVHKNAQ